MNVKKFGKTIATFALTAGVVAVAIAPSPADACSGRWKKSAAKPQDLPGWVGAAALIAIAGSVAGNEIMKRASTDEPVS